MIFTAEEQVKFGLPDEQQLAVLTEKYLAGRMRCGSLINGPAVGTGPDECTCLQVECPSPDCAVTSTPPTGC